MRLLVDTMCGGIVSYLRMCGHDTAYAMDRGIESDGELKQVTTDEQRRLVTRDQDLATTTDGILLTATSTEGQLAELADAGVELVLRERPQYCGNCNGRLRVVGPDEQSTTPAYTPEPSENDLFACQECGQYFWRGSHWDRVETTLADL